MATFKVSLAQIMIAVGITMLIPLAALASQEPPLPGLLGNFLVLDDPAAPGRSGGASITESGLLIGICSRSDGQKHSCYQSSEQIYRLLDQAGYSRLYTEKDEPSSSLYFWEYLHIVFRTFLAFLVARLCGHRQFVQLTGPAHRQSEAQGQCFICRHVLLVASESLVINAGVRLPVCSVCVSELVACGERMIAALTEKHAVEVDELQRKRSETMRRIVEIMDRSKSSATVMKLEYLQRNTGKRFPVIILCSRPLLAACFPQGFLTLF